MSAFVATANDRARPDDVVISVFLRCMQLLDSLNAFVAAVNDTVSPCFMSQACF